MVDRFGRWFFGFGFRLGLPSRVGRYSVRAGLSVVAPSTRSLSQNEKQQKKMIFSFVDRYKVNLLDYELFALSTLYDYNSNIGVASMTPRVP